MKLPRLTADDQLRQAVTVCARLARAIWDWYQRPSTRQCRGRKLFREWLSPEQLAQYDARDYFEVIDCHTGKRYRIREGVGANVYDLDDAGRMATGWCFLSPRISSSLGT
jgi:hypothetical protein